MNCCNDYGVCTQGADCAARGCSQAKGRANVDLWIKTVSTPPQYLPQVDAPPLGFFEDFLEYARTVLLPWTCGILLGSAFTAFCFVFGQSLG